MNRMFNKTERGNRRKLRKNMTKAEKALWEYLKGRQLLGYKFRRQHGVGNYIVDFYCHKLKLVVEVDGSIHQEIEIMNNDTIREAFLKEQSLLVIRFSNEQVVNEINFCLRTLRLTIRRLSSLRSGEVPEGRRGSK